VTLRLRIAAGASAAVALTVLAAAIGVYVAVRAELRGQVDRSLSQRAQLFAPPLLIGPPGGAQGAPQTPATISPGAGQAAAGGLTVTSAAGARKLRPPPGVSDDGFFARLRAFPRAVQPARFGGASGFVQFVAAEGNVVVPGGQGATPPLALSATDKAIAQSGRGRSFSDRTTKGTHLRVLTTGVHGLGAVLVARPLAEVDRELGNVLLILALVGAGGIAVAGLLGALVARAALAPVVSFTRRTETVSGSLDASQRVEVKGRDELARLARSFNSTLDALERSAEAQRQLVADASHELRTPMASLRANIQVLAEAERLPAEEQERLRADIISELDELTSLVSDVVELARGSQVTALRDEVRLDEIVHGAVERARRRSDLRFALELEPTVVHGDPARVDRAVSNLLDNARKWSPPGGLVEVSLRGGTVTVRDHGPGFAEADLPNVFERFYRADHARQLPGSGLGLAIVRQGAEAHGGRVSAENAPGGGARLQVSFGPHQRIEVPHAEPAIQSHAV
jgi:two-component system, OmpR family, sensor histidine kinase MprB